MGFRELSSLEDRNLHLKIMTARILRGVGNV